MCYAYTDRYMALAILPRGFLCMSSPNVTSLVEQGIAACRSGDKVRAFDLLVQALHRDARNETAWLWLSAVVGNKAEQRFCLERVLDINPQHAAVRQGLQKFSA